MARSAEVVTLKSLDSLLAAAKLEFDRAAEAKKVAAQVENIPDAFRVLNESVTRHENDGFATTRKVIVKVLKGLDEASATTEQASALVKLAKALKLFPADVEVPAQASVTGEEKK